MKRNFSVIFVVTALIILLGGQGVMAAPLGQAEVMKHKAHHQIRLRLVDEGEAVKIARNHIPSRQADLESVGLTIFQGRIARRLIAGENRVETITHQCNWIADRAGIDYKVNSCCSQNRPVDWKKAVEIAREKSQPVEVEATAMKIPASDGKHGRGAVLQNGSM